ncbi:mitochondrial ribosomal subunit L23 protein [Rutstroemia sp. NJR-2017a BVV2]|nr:mitochondrial ribosomal subunit L23 protein [Rutstroemia sp. NJR-2017a BVV2]
MACPKRAQTRTQTNIPVRLPSPLVNPPAKLNAYSPNFTLTLIRTPNLPPSFASFIVPLNLNKLDLRDYLYNAYGIEVRGVRSYIQQQKLTQGKRYAVRQTPRQWFRPRSIKRMTVEMVKPFVWPEEPKDLSAWDQEQWKKRQEMEKGTRESYQPDARQRPNNERLSIAQQAKALLQGEDEWEPSENVWEDIGEAVEVERDVEIPVEGNERAR